jgi:threonylcarbamoyladenosine tRNA methylthiotransferase MtaB
MRIFLDQIGCRLNYSEMETLAQRLAAAGHYVVGSPEDAQVIVFNSCAVTTGAERDSRKRVGALHRANGAAQIAVTGCLATLAPAQTAQLPGVGLVVGNDRKELLPMLLEPWSAELDSPEALLRLQPDGAPLEFPSADERRQRTRAFVKVQDGCNNRCTFCIVTALRGESRSRSLADIARDVQQLAEEGVQEVVLTGVHLGSYGRDLDAANRTDLKQLVAALLTHTDIPRLRLSSLEPWELADGFFDLWANWPGRLCPHLHLPLQAGTDKQLRAMARRCTTASFARLLATARAAIPDLTVTTDLITGFPGESEADFAEGLAYVAALRFMHAHIFPYSARVGTAAASFADATPAAAKRARLRRLVEAVEATGVMERTRFLNTARPVLWEGVGQPLAEQTGRLWSGLTDNYLRVHAVAPVAIDLHNCILPARLTQLDGAIFAGEIMWDADPQRHNSEFSVHNSLFNRPTSVGVV